MVNGEWKHLIKFNNNAPPPFLTLEKDCKNLVDLIKW